MSSPGNQVVKSSLLTPARRIGLSRTRKSQKIEICSPLLGVSEPILKNPASEYENKLFHTTGRSSFSETSLEGENSSLINLSESKIEENTVEQENTSIARDSCSTNSLEVENASLSNLNDSQISNKNTAEVAETLSSNSTISKNKTEDPAASSVMCSPNLCETFSGKIKRKLEMDNNGFNEKFNSKKSKGRLSRNSPKIEDQPKNIGKKTEKEKELVVDLYNITEPLLTNSTTDSETDHNNYNSKLLRTTSSTDSENDIFTSSPEAAQLQREKLMKLMETLTEDIEAQESLLKRLQQVKIYRRIQNIDEIKKTTIQWTEGFKQALMDLLLKLQTHGSMTMGILIKKLKISPNIVDKLNLDEEL